MTRTILFKENSFDFFFSFNLPYITCHLAGLQWEEYLGKKVMVHAGRQQSESLDLAIR